MPCYNHEHRHSGLALLTPADVHYGRAQKRLEQRSRVLDEAFLGHPERFKGQRTTPGSVPEVVWIKPPPTTVCAEVAEPTLSPLSMEVRVPGLEPTMDRGMLQDADATT